MENKIIKWLNEHKNDNKSIEEKLDILCDLSNLYQDDYIDAAIAHLVVLCEELECDREFLVLEVLKWKKSFYRSVAFDIKNNFEFKDNQVIKKKPSKMKNEKSILDFTTSIVEMIDLFTTDLENTEDMLDDAIIVYTQKGQKTKTLKLS